MSGIGGPPQHIRGSGPDGPEASAWRPRPLRRPRFGAGAARIGPAVPPTWSPVLVAAALALVLLLGAAAGRALGPSGGTLAQQGAGTSGSGGGDAAGGSGSGNGQAGGSGSGNGTAGRRDDDRGRPDDGSSGSSGSSNGGGSSGDSAGDGGAGPPTTAGGGTTSATPTTAAPSTTGTPSTTQSPATTESPSTTEPPPGTATARQAQCPDDVPASPQGGEVRCYVLDGEDDPDLVVVPGIPAPLPIPAPVLVPVGGDTGDSNSTYVDRRTTVFVDVDNQTVVDGATALERRTQRLVATLALLLLVPIAVAVVAVAVLALRRRPRPGGLP